MIKVLIAISWITCLIAMCMLMYIKDLDSSKFARGYKLVVWMMVILAFLLGGLVALTIVL